MGQRITNQARERHAQYLETGSSKELSAVLMTLSDPSGRLQDKEEEETEEMKGEEEDEEEVSGPGPTGLEDHQEEAETDGGVVGKVGLLMVNADGPGSKGVERALCSTASGGDLSEACDAPEL